MALKEQSRYIVADLMPAPRTLDPLGFSQEPNYVTDPVREAELVREIVNKIRYVIWSYHQAKKLGLDNESFNASLKQLKLAVNNPRTNPSRLVRRHPFIEMAINVESRELAGVTSDADLDKVTGEHNGKPRSMSPRGRI